MFDGGKPGGVVFLRGQWPRVFEGAARWRIRAVGGGGLYSEHVISLESLARPSRRPSNRPLRPGRPGLR
ncbi:MAG: hypothetical protein CL908_18515 [Deltaproteobacteria bacterium]|nr:hypothetical protein [Deltaproteobacteria bacterium]